MTSEELAKAFHDVYERLAPEHNYETRKASAKPWNEVPENNRKLMVAVVSELLDQGAIVSATDDVMAVGYDTYNITKGQIYRVVHYFPVPPAAYNEESWKRWLLDRLIEVETHEACEFL